MDATHPPTTHDSDEPSDVTIETLERLVQRETLREAFAVLTPDELLLAAGRVAGMSDIELGDLFCIMPATVSRRLMLARKRIQAQVPELRVFLEGRSGSRYHGYSPPEHDTDATYTLAEAAEQLGVDAATVALWLQKQKFPNAYRAGKEWWIPAGDVALYRSEA